MSNGQRPVLHSAVPTSARGKPAHAADSGLNESQVLMSQARQADTAPCPCRRHRADLHKKSNLGTAAPRYPGHAQQGGFHETKDCWDCMNVAIVALAGTASAQNSPGAAALDASLRSAVERRDVPGVVALVTNRERVLYQSAFGVADVSTGRALTTDSMFRIASMTKPVTSLALMQLIEQGRLGLDDPAENTCRSSRD
jgi:CubicO group peptidase (beta-lactamase class C family)